MIYIYYHIYLTNGTAQLVNNQLKKIKEFVKQKHEIVIGINTDEFYVNKVDEFKWYLANICPVANVRAINTYKNEWTTLSLIESDRMNFNINDYVFYLHTKGVSYSDNKSPTFANIHDWRLVMEYFNLNDAKKVLQILGAQNYNTYGIILSTKIPEKVHYTGNFWWANAGYIKSLDITGVDKQDRYSAELDFINKGKDWKPYSAKETFVDHYNQSYHKILYDRKFILMRLPYKLYLKIRNLF